MINCSVCNAKLLSESRHVGGRGDVSFWYCPVAREQRFALFMEHAQIHPWSFWNWCKADDAREAAHPENLGEVRYVTTAGAVPA